MQVWIETRTRFNRTNESSFVSFYFELSFANKKKDNCLFKHLTLNNSHTAKWLIVPWFGQIFQRIFAFKKNKSRFKQTCCRSFEKMRLKKQLLWNRNRVQQVSSSNSILCSEKSTFAKKVFLLSRKKENKKAFDICFKKKRKACKSKLFGQNCNILLSKKAKQSVPKEKKYSHQRCLQEKTSSKRTEQLLFLHTSQWLCCEQNFPAQNKKSLKKNVHKKKY